MGDGDDRAALGQLLKGLHDGSLAGQVHLAGGLVQEQHGAVGQEGAGQGQALGLTARQPQAGLADLRLQPLGHERHLLVQAGHLQGLPHLRRRCVGLGQAQVVGDRPGEQPGRLRHQRGGRAHLVLRGGAQLGALDADGSAPGQQVAGEHCHERRLARPRGADHRQALAAAHAQVDALQHRVGVPGGLDVVEHDGCLSGHGGGGRGLGTSG